MRLRLRLLLGLALLLQSSSSSSGSSSSSNAAKQPQPPVVTYLTTSTTSHRNGVPQGAAMAATANGMQPAFVYDANMPQQEEENQQVVVAPPSSPASAPQEGEASKKVIGSSVVTSVSVVLNGNEPQFTDALGHKVPKPQPSLQVASPIDLLNPDRYEFYTFDEHGELVKRLMTMQEIQSIVANGDGEGPSIIHTAPLLEREPDKNVQDIVDSVQNVLNKEVNSTKTSSSGELLPVLDTPDVSSSWSLILPAIFGNTGGQIFPQQKPQQIVMQAESELLEASSTQAPPTRATKKPKPKPSKRKPGTKRKPTTTTQATPQVVQEELDPMESVYTGMQQYQQSLAAANIQNFDMHMQPIYQKLPNSTPKPESTTRRVFYNNLEIIQTPASSTTVTTAGPTTERIVANSQLAKKPAHVHPKPSTPHRVKKPNGNGSGASNASPQQSGGKQKVKKKTTTTAAPTTSSTSASLPTETTTTTIPTPVESEPELEPSSTTTQAPPATTPKKKKRKPTRTPGQGGQTAKPTKPKRKPAAKPKPAQPTPQVTEEQPQQQLVSTQKPPRPQRPHKKPAKITTTTTTTTTTTAVPITTTTTEAAAEPPAEEIASSEANVEAEVTPTEPTKLQHNRVHAKPAYTSTATIATSTTTAATPPTPTKQQQQYLHSKPQHHTISTTAQPVEEPASYGLINVIPSTTTTTTTTTTAAPSLSPEPALYPLPSYEVAQQLPSSYLELNKSPLKKTPLPSLAQIQQQLQLQQQQQSSLSADQLHSMDQIVQSLTQDQLANASEQNAGQEEVLEEATSYKPQPLPVKYDSAENVEQMEALAQKKKISVTSTSSAAPTTTIVTSSPALIANYGGSTLATMLAEEDASVTMSPIDSTESSSVERETTIGGSNESEQPTPIVVITARPQYFAVTKQPELLTQTQTHTHKVEEEETTELPGHTQFLVTTPMYQEEDIATTKIPAKEASNVVKFEPLYAEVPQTVITEITEANTETKTEESTENFTESYTEASTIPESPAYGTTLQQPRLPVTARPQQSDAVTLADDDSYEATPQVADLISQLNLEVLKPTDQISMSDFQTQAATVASTLVDGSNTLVSDIYMNSNETKDELAFLMSDVIQQITNEEQPQYKPLTDDSHRLTNFAQLNASFLLTPSAEIETQGKVESPSTTTKAPAAAYESELSTIAPIIPSKEELIKQETAYLDSLKPETSTALPVETTTYRVPLLSLSQIYAQQQQAEEEAQQMYEQESVNKVETEAVTEVVTEATTEAITEAATEDNYPQEVEKEVKTTTEQPSYAVQQQTEEFSSQPSEETTASSLEESSELPNYEKLEEKFETKPEEKPDEDEPMPEMMMNGYDEENSGMLTESAETSTTESNYGYGETTEATTERLSQPEEQPETTTANAYSDSLPEQTSTEEQQKQEKPTEVVSLEKNEDESQTLGAYIVDNLSESFEDSATNAAQLQPQYTAQPAEHEQSASTASEEQQSTEVPSDVSAMESTGSEMTISAEQATEKVELSTVRTQIGEEAMEEISDELMATISEEDANTTLEQDMQTEKVQLDDEDPYIKLGETTASVVVHRPTEIEVDDSKSTLKSTEQEESYKVTLQPQPAQPVANYGVEEADEEDEEDQTGYQAPQITTSTTAKTSTSTTTSTTTTAKPTPSTTKRLNTLKPVSYYVQPSLINGYNQLEPNKVLPYNANTAQQHQRPSPSRPASLTNLMASSTQATRPPVKLEPSPVSAQGLEASSSQLDEDLQSFVRLCNELAFSYWKAITSEKISSARSLVISPFALTSMLSMMFLGARGSTSGEMNEILKLDDMVTFNPHLVFKNITNSVEQSMDGDIATAAFVREIFSDRANGKILQFFKEKTQQLYAGHVEEVNFHVVNDIIRRRTNLLVKRHTMGKVLEYLRTNSVWVNGPLATISANLFQTDCSHASTVDRDGEMFFQVHPTVRQRRLVPIPAVLYRSGFTAGYEPKLDATIVAFGRLQSTVSTIYVMPGHQSSVSPADNLDRLERQLVELAFGENAWSSMLTSLMDRPGMEVQLPRFSHRSFVNASLGLQKMGLKGLFKSDFADLRGLTGAGNRDIYLSDMIQINTFSTCGESKISDHHHVEMYPAPPLRKRNKDVDVDDDAIDSSESVIDFGSLVQESALGRGFYDDLLDPKYLELPLPLRPRQARVPDAPRLRFDKPFLYFVRHNPTGMILFMGRFNPRLLP